MGYVALRSLVMRKDAPPPEPFCTLAERIRRPAFPAPVIALIAFVIGAMKAPWHEITDDLPWLRRSARIARAGA